MTSRTPLVNPYARKGPTLAHNEVNMGRQSQQRVSNQHKRKFKLAASHSFKKTARKGDQLTLGGEVAFQSERDCIVCKARSLALFTPGVRIPKRSHHQLCVKNKSTKGKGSLSVLAVAGMEDDKRYQSLTSPIRPEERGSWKYLTKEAGTTFFNPVRKSAPVCSLTTIQQQKQEPGVVTPRDLCVAVADMVENAEFCEKHKSKSAPLAMVAFANVVSEKIIQTKKENDYFHGMTMVVPDCNESDDNPHYHSIVGQKLLLVDWIRLYGLQIPCADAACPGTLKNDRSNFSKNKTLFPIFSLDGAPAWCIVMMMTCPCCHRRFYANEGDVLINVPDYAAHDYPVSPTYAQSGSACHLSRNATEVFSVVMLTYGNGDMCSRLMYNAINRAYIERIKVYYSRAKKKQCRPKVYLAKDGVYIKQYPPLGETVRSMYDEAASSNKNPWRVSDFERNTREIQGVRCDDGIFTQDHTFQATKNYLQKKALGATAAWTVGTGTGEVAAVVLVKTTKTEDYAHAAQQLLKREHFNPKAMYSDTWPHKMEFWQLVCPGIHGRLGLFHFEKRIISTLRKTHIDYFDAITDLLASLYVYCSSDYEELLTALKEGTLSTSGKKYSSSEISHLKGTKLFRDRYAKYLRKQMHQPQTIIQMLDDWFCRYKVSSSDPIKSPAGGRLDPIRMVPLFTADTKAAIANCKDKAKYLEDPLPLNEMYDEVPPNPNAPHKLSQYLSKRGESKLEAFHDRFAHYANCGMRNSLADNLNLAGTARYNLSIRHKRSWMITTTKKADDRKNLPAAWERVVPYFNHTELWYVNRMAAQVGCPHPFPNAEVLGRDNGERFFSQYLMERGRTPKSGGFGECLCLLCTGPQPARQEITGPSEEERQLNTTRATIDLLVPLLAAGTNTNAATATNEEKTTTRKKHNNNCQTAVAMPPPRQHNTPIANSIITYTPNNNYRAPAHQYQRAPIAPAMLLPMTYQLPLYFVAPQYPPPACCDKYKAWLTRRVGRPPHHPLCSQQKR